MIDIANTTKNTPPDIAYEKITHHVHGTNYELSLVFCGTHLMRRINRETRNKDYATNVLSFPLSESSGELFICLDVCARQHKDYNRSFENFVAFLFVHGLVHLKGLDHGDTMDKLEASICKKFSI